MYSAHPGYPQNSGSCCIPPWNQTNFTTGRGLKQEAHVTTLILAQNSLILCESSTMRLSASAEAHGSQALAQHSAFHHSLWSCLWWPPFCCSSKALTITSPSTEKLRDSGSPSWSLPWGCGPSDVLTWKKYLTLHNTQMPRMSLAAH